MYAPTSDPEQERASSSADALLRSEARYRQLIEQASDGIVLTDAGGKIVEANTRFCEIAGRRGEALFGHRLGELLATEDGVPHAATAELPPGQTALHDRALLRPDGSRVSVEITTSPFGGDGERVLAVVRDVTARKRAEEMLRRSEEQLYKSQRMEAIGNLTAGITHDFNNILTGIFGFADLALAHLADCERDGRAPDLARLRRHLERIKEGGQLGATLTRQLLAFTRQQHLERRSVDVNSTIDAVLGMLKRIVEENVSISFHPAPDAGNVFADPGQIERILANLAANARDAMPGGGRLVIETENVTLDRSYLALHPYARAGRYVLIRVTDTGTGMPPEVLSRVFEPFFTTKDVDKGTGLGLATTYGTVKQHGGTIEVYSEVGSGTSFKIYLPLDEHPAAPVPESPQTPLTGGSETILLTEDEGRLSEVTRDILTGLGYRVVTARDGRDAAALYEEMRGGVDLIIMDVIMPRTDGPDAYRSIRDSYPDPPPPIIFTSGYSPELIRTRLAADSETPAPLLPKPYDRETLGRKVREVLDAHAPTSSPHRT